MSNPVSPAFGIITVFLSYFGRCVVITHCDFSLHSLIVHEVDYLFMCLFAICISSLVKMSLHVFCPFSCLIIF